MKIELIINKVKKEVSTEIMRIKNENGMPMFLMELIVTGILGDMRDAAARDFAEETIKEEGRKKDGELRREQTNVHAVEESREAVHEDEQSNEKEAGEI